MMMIVSVGHLMNSFANVKQTPLLFNFSFISSKRVF